MPKKQPLVKIDGLWSFSPWPWIAIPFIMCVGTPDIIDGLVSLLNACAASLAESK